MAEQPEHEHHESKKLHGLDKTSVIANILNGCEDFTLDASGKIISSNLEAVNITGYEEWEVIGRNISIFYPEQDRKSGEHTADLKKAGQDNKLTFSAWRVKKRNIAFWAQVTFTCLKDEDGFVNGYKMILKDQTHRLISNNRVKRFRDEYLNLFNNQFIGIFKYRLSDGKVILINDMAAEIVEAGKEPKMMPDIFRNREEFEGFSEILLRDGRVHNYEFRTTRKTAETWARIDCRLFIDEGFVEGVIADITESKRQLLELKRLNAELDHFIYHASHDLRSPLTTLLGLINLLESDRQTDVLHYSSMMRERVIYLDELLKDLALISYNNKMEINVKPIDFELMMALEIAKLKSETSTIHVQVHSQDSTQVCSDQARLHSVFGKLIVHSIKHRNAFLKKPRLDITITIAEGKALVHLKDNDRELSISQIHQLFGMFYKTNAEVAETGLGLYIAKAMVERLQGKISVTSKEGWGTAFEVEIPSLVARDSMHGTQPKPQSQSVTC